MQSALWYEPPEKFKQKDNEKNPCFFALSQKRFYPRPLALNWGTLINWLCLFLAEIAAKECS